MVNLIPFVKGKQIFESFILCYLERKRGICVSFVFHFTRNNLSRMIIIENV
jgi:hypothetical protein